jgi:hypothetical protein
VEVKRDRARHRVLIASPRLLAQLRFCESFSELGRGRIRRIAGARSVIPLQQVGIE